MGIKKKGKLRYCWGDLDLVSAGLVLIGIYLTIKNFDIGWIIAIIGIFKQFSGK